RKVCSSSSSFGIEYSEPISSLVKIETLAMLF
ncbi:MAG: hypothetical protein ACI86H_002753, partial [bacterium]